MDTTARTQRFALGGYVIAVAITVVFTSGSVAASPTLRTPSGTAVWIVGGSSERHALVAWALSRFDAAGLTLPDIDIHFHPDDEPCRGHRGLRTGGLRRERIDICRPAPMLILHELAHSWGAALPEETKAAFTRLRHLDTWSQAGARWRDRASEHQAQIVAWGLMEQPIRLMTLPNNRPTDIAAAFIYLTGTAPLHRSTEPARDTRTADLVASHPVPGAQPPSGQLGPSVPSDPKPRMDTETATPNPAAVRLTLHYATSEQTDLVVSVLGDFAAAGLELPSLDITFVNSDEDCHRQPGLIRFGVQTAEIELCNPTPHVIRHVFAHAWESRAVSDDTRAQFLRYWGLEAWNDHTFEWNKRGIEKAADTIAISLLIQSPTDDPNLFRYLCGYQLLTGNPLPHDIPLSPAPPQQVCSLS